MNSSTLSSRAIKRVLRDLVEIQKDPIAGISICMPDINDPFTLHGNILVKDGIYEGVLIHIVVHIPEEFPIKPPAVNIAPGLDFGIKYHSHIYDNLTYGNSICTDLTSNFAGHFSVIDAHGKPTRSGWTPAYTLSSVLMQLQVFFADPDMPKEALPSKEDIQKLKDHISQYRLDIRTCNGQENSVEIITHSYENPYPPLSSEIPEPVVSEDKETIEEEEKPAKTGFVKKEESIGSNSTANSEIEKQSGGQNISILSSPSSEKKQELLEELKEGEIEQVKEVLANGKEVVCDWDKPLKKVSKEGSNKTQKQKNTVVVKVVKKAPVKQTNKVDLLAEFNKQRKKYDRVTNNRKISYQHTIQLYASQASATQANQKALVPSGYQNVNTKEVEIEVDSFSTKSDIYKESVTENKATFKQRHQELSNKLICSVSKVNVFDNSKPILGYPIDLEKDAYGRLWPTPIMEILSYDSFIFNIQQHFEKLDNYHRVKFTSSFGSQYNYWLPVYINNEHFERSKQYIFNAIAIIYGGVEGKKENDFHPLMVLKVLPPILVKTAIHFLKGTIHQSIVGIDAYCQLYRLFVKLVEMFPEIKEAIDTEVQNFCKSDTNRHKKVAGDLGEFIIKLSLSSKGIQDPHLINMVFKEHITRQVSWSLKKDRGLGLKEQCSNFVERFMIVSQVSNQFFLTKMEIARLLLDEDVKADLEKRCGILNENTMQLFRGRLSWIQKNVVQDWRVLVKALQQEAYIHDDQKMESYLGKAFDRAKAKGYLENTY